MATMREGLKLSRKIANSESFNKYKGDEIFPGKNVQSDDELDAYIRNVRVHQHSSIFHAFSLFSSSRLYSYVYPLLYCHHPENNFTCDFNRQIFCPKVSEDQILSFPIFLYSSYLIFYFLNVSDCPHQQCTCRHLQNGT